MANYSQQDFTSTYEELLSIVESSTTKWHPRTSTEADPGVVILKALAFLEDKANYRFDMSLDQAFLDSVSDPQSAYELLRELGYLMKAPRAATGTISLLPNSSWPIVEGTTTYEQVELPIFTRVTDATKTLSFFTTSTYSFAPDASLPYAYQVDVQAGEPVQIVKDGYSYFTLKDVDERGRLYLGKTGLAQNGVFVLTRVEYQDSTGSLQEFLVKDWRYLDYAILKPEGYWYTVETSETGEMYVQFPDNFSQLLADRQVVVYATYTTGAASNIAKNIISRFVDEAKWKSYFSVSQPSAFVTGQDQESIELAVQHYYETKDVCNTLITASDFVAALKNLVISVAVADENFRAGSNYFNNVIVRTAADRKTKVLTASFGTEYQLFVPDSEEPMNQIDVLPLTTLGEAPTGISVSDLDYAYASTFRSSTSEGYKDKVKGDFQLQLQENIAVDASLAVVEPEGTNIADTRFLAVTTPEITVRISNYSLATKADLQQKIINYLYSTYSAQNLTAGQPLSVQKLINDITALSPTITSVTIPDLVYDVYSKYEPVDGESIKVSVEPGGVASNLFTLTTSEPADWSINYTAYYTRSGSDPNYEYTRVVGVSAPVWASNTYYSRSITLQEEILARSVLQGSIPLYNYYNRENTRTTAEVTSTYGSAVTKTNVLAVPFNATSYNSLGSGQAVSPELDVAAFPPYYLPTSDSDSVAVLRSRNELVQFRKPSKVVQKTFGYGMTYSFNRLKPFPGTAADSITLQGNDNILAAGTRLQYSSNTVIKLDENTGLSSDYFQYDSGAGGYKCTGTWTTCALTAAITCKDGTVIGFTSGAGNRLGYTPGSSFTVGGVVYTYPSLTIYDGSEYTLQEGETLVINSASTGEGVASFSAGDTIQPSGFSLAATNGNNSSVMTTTQSISLLADKSVPFNANDYVYFLSMNNPKPVSDSYMLEENELLVIADKAITEYVTFGPGSQIKISNEGTLTGSSLIQLEQVTSDMFTVLTSDISITSYDFISARKGAVILGLSSDELSGWFGTPSASFTSRENLSELTIYYDVPIDDFYTELWVPGSDPTVQDVNDWLVKHSSSQVTVPNTYNARRLLFVQSDAQGVAVIEPASGTTPPTVSINDVTLIDSTSALAYITLSTPVSSTFYVGDGQPLLPEGVKAFVSYGTYSTNYSGLATGVTPDYSVPGQITFFISKEVPHDADVVTFSFPTVSGADKYLIYFHSPDVDMASSSALTCAVTYNSNTVSTISLTAQMLARGYSLEVPPQNGSYSYTVTVEYSGNDESEGLAGKSIIVSAFSVVKEYASQLGVKDLVDLEAVLSDLDTDGRYLPELYPDESFKYPLNASSFFVDTHPANKHVFPYVELQKAGVDSIRILSSRGY